MPILCYDVLCYAMLCYAMLCYAMLRHAIYSSTSATTEAHATAPDRNDISPNIAPW